MLYKICVGKTTWWICGMHLIRSNTAQVGHLPNFIPIRSTELHSLTSPWLVELSSRCASLKFTKAFHKTSWKFKNASHIFYFTSLKVTFQNLRPVVTTSQEIPAALRGSYKASCYMEFVGISRGCYGILWDFIA